MRDATKKTLGRGSGNRERTTRTEAMVVVGAIAAFASIYAYIVVSAIMSNP